MKYPGTNIYTDGSKYRRGAVSCAAIILCNDRFLCEITDAVLDTTVTAGHMEIEAICRAIFWITRHPDKVCPPYHLYTDYMPFISLFNSSNQGKCDDTVWQAIQKGRELRLELHHITAHAQKHNGNKMCDITCRALCGVILRNGVKASTLFTEKLGIMR